MPMMIAAKTGGRQGPRLPGWSLHFAEQGEHAAMDFVADRPDGGQI